MKFGRNVLCGILILACSCVGCGKKENAVLQESGVSALSILPTEIKKSTKKMVFYPYDPGITIETADEIERVYELLDSVIVTPNLETETKDGSAILEIITEDGTVVRIKITSNIISVNNNKYSVNDNILNDLRKIFKVKTD